ncbi:MAG: YajG family lipoprotein [Gammaproteobacteria bacterium]|nr:YajG family lipoprotein [Gammaproteobacteria bacterium]
MLKRLAWPLLVGSLLVLVGCAHSPQTLDVRPALESQPARLGNQQPVVVVVTDTRAEKTLGTRGGIYPQTSSLSLSDQVLPRLRQEVDSAVRALGYTPVPEGTPNAGQLTVSLAELTYQVPGNVAYVTEANLTAAFTAQARKGGEQYRGRYSASANHRFGYAPNQATNTRLVTEVMNDALTRLFKDPAIAEVLGR